MAHIIPNPVFPIHGGSAFETTTPYSGTFIPSIWSGKLLSKFFATTTFGAVSNTNWESDVKNKGDKVIIRQAPNISINEYEVGMTLNYEVPEPETIELLIDQGHYYGFQLNDVLAYQSDMNLMNMFSDDASEQLKIHVDTNCWKATFDGAHAANKGLNAGAESGSYNMGTDAAPVVLDGDSILETILAMASILDEQNIPESDRWLVMTPLERYMLMQSNLAQAYYTGDSTSPVRNGRIGMIDRFQLYVSNLLPRAAAGQDWDGEADGTALKRHAIVAGHKSAITFAAGISKNEQLRNPTDFGDIVRGLMVYGRRVVKPESMVTLIAAG